MPWEQGGERGHVKDIPLEQQAEDRREGEQGDLARRVLLVAAPLAQVLVVAGQMVLR